MSGGYSSRAKVDARFYKFFPRSFQAKRPNMRQVIAASSFSRLALSMMLPHPFCRNQPEKPRYPLVEKISYGRFPLIPPVSSLAEAIYFPWWRVLILRAGVRWFFFFPPSGYFWHFWLLLAILDTSGTSEEIVFPIGSTSYAILIGRIRPMSRPMVRPMKRPMAHPMRAEASAMCHVCRSPIPCSISA